MIRGRVFHVGVDQHVDVGKQHLESAPWKLEPGFVVCRVQRPGAVNVDAGAWTDTTGATRRKGDYSDGSRRQVSES